MLIHFCILNALYINSTFFIYFMNSFFCNIIEIYFWIYKIYPFQVYNLMIFTKLTNLYNHCTQISFIFLFFLGQFLKTMLRYIIVIFQTSEIKSKSSKLLERNIMPHTKDWGSECIRLLRGKAERT